MAPDLARDGVASPALEQCRSAWLALQQASDDSTWPAILLQALLAGAGFWLALVLFTDLRQRSAHADIPGVLRGLPIELIGAGVMAMAFSGFNGLFAQ